MNESWVRKTVRHKKTGRLYYVTLDDVTIEKTMERAVLYRSMEDNRAWIRPYAEFTDGRFEIVTEQ